MISYTAPDTPPRRSDAIHFSNVLAVGSGMLEQWGSWGTGRPLGLRVDRGRRTWYGYVGVLQGDGHGCCRCLAGTSFYRS